MEFHGFCQVGAKHYVDITDYGKRQRIEVTAEDTPTTAPRPGALSWAKPGLGAFAKASDDAKRTVAAD
jgi:hypothetical protein